MCKEFNIISQIMQMVEFIFCKQNLLNQFRSQYNWPQVSCWSLNIKSFNNQQVYLVVFLVSNFN